MSTSQTSTQSPVARRSAEAQLRGLVAKFAPAHQRLVGAARRWLRMRLPTAHEVVYEYRDCFVISYSPSEHGYEGVLAIRASAEGVKLYFNQGKGLPDPEKLLAVSSNHEHFTTEHPIRGGATIGGSRVAQSYRQVRARE